MGFLWSHLPEPIWWLQNRNAQAQDLQPYSRLVPPAWVAATVAYLKDLDAMAAHLGTSGRKGPKSQTDPPLVNGKPPGWKPPPPGKGKKQDKGGGGADPPIVK